MEKYRPVCVYAAVGDNCRFRGFNAVTAFFLHKGIQNLYLAKIRILMSAAGVVGFLPALLLLPMLTGHISRFFGEQPLDALSLLWAVVAVALIYCIILLFAKKVLKRIKAKTSPGCLF